MLKAGACLLAASSASALVIGVPLTVTNVRALAPEMQAWDAFGIGRKTAVPMGGISAWDEVGNEVVTPPTKTYANTNENDTFKHDIGRKVPVPMGGTTGWLSPGEDQFAQAPKKSYVQAEDLFKHGTGRVVPVALGGIRGWAEVQKVSQDA